MPFASRKLGWVESACGIPIGMDAKVMMDGNTVVEIILVDHGGTPRIVADTGSSSLQLQVTHSSGEGTIYPIPNTPSILNVERDVK